MSPCRTSARLLGAALAISLLVSACGDDDGTATDDASSTTAAPADSEAADDAGDPADQEAGDEAASEDEAAEAGSDDGSEAGDEDAGDGGEAAADSGDPAYIAAKETLAAFLDEHQPEDAAETSTTVAGCPLIDTATLSAAQESVGGDPIGDDLETQISWGGPPQIHVGCGVNLNDPAGERPLVAVAAGDTGEQTLENLIADSAQPLTVEGDRAVGCDDTGAFCLALTVVDGLAVTAVVNGAAADPETTLAILDDLQPAVLDTLAQG